MSFIMKSNEYSSVESQDKTIVCVEQKKDGEKDKKKRNKKKNNNTTETITEKDNTDKKDKKKKKKKEDKTEIFEQTVVDNEDKEEDKTEIFEQTVVDNDDDNDDDKKDKKTHQKKTKNNKNTTLLFNYFLNFLNEHASIEEAVTIWKSDECQKKFINMTQKISKEKIKKENNKDPNKPKGVRNAYIFFCSTENRAIIKKNNPHMNTKDMTIFIANKWKESSNDVKQPYIDMWDEDKKRYKEEMENYTPSLSDSNSDEPSIKKKKPLSAWQLFCNDKRTEVSNTIADGREKVPGSEVMKYMGTLWKEINKKDKQFYIDKAKSSKLL